MSEPYYNTDARRASAAWELKEAAKADVSEAFELAAEMFYRDTGMLAIGKDQPAAWGNYPTYEQRSAAWRQWRQDMGV